MPQRLLEFNAKSRRARPRKRGNRRETGKCLRQNEKESVNKGKQSKRGNANWQPKLYERVSVKVHPISDAIKGITSKFMHVYEGP
jgi:hypothetical protein